MAKIKTLIGNIKGPKGDPGTIEGLDPTLSVSGAAPDSKMVGETFSDVYDQMDGQYQDVDDKITQIKDHLGMVSKNMIKVGEPMIPDLYSFNTADYLIITDQDISAQSSIPITIENSTEQFELREDLIFTSIYGPEASFGCSVVLVLVDETGARYTYTDVGEGVFIYADDIEGKYITINSLTLSFEQGISADEVLTFGPLLRYASTPAVYEPYTEPRLDMVEARITSVESKIKKRKNNYKALYNGNLGTVSAGQIITIECQWTLYESISVVIRDAVSTNKPIVGCITIPNHLLGQFGVGLGSSFDIVPRSNSTFAAELSVPNNSSLAIRPIGSAANSRYYVDIFGNYNH